MEWGPVAGKVNDAGLNWRLPWMPLPDRATVNVEGTASGPVVVVCH